MTTDHDIIKKQMGNLTEEHHIDTAPNFCKLCVSEMLGEARADERKRIVELLENEKTKADIEFRTDYFRTDYQKHRDLVIERLIKEIEAME